MKPVKRKLGRWFESGYGLGLEVDTGHTDPDLRWAIVGHVETVGKRNPYYRVLMGGCTVSSPRTLDAAKRLLIEAAGVTVVVE